MFVCEDILSDGINKFIRTYFIWGKKDEKLLIDFFLVDSFNIDGTTQA